MKQKKIRMTIKERIQDAWNRGREYGIDVSTRQSADAARASQAEKDRARRELNDSAARGAIHEMANLARANAQLADAISHAMIDGWSK